MCLIKSFSLLVLVILSAPRIAHPVELADLVDPSAKVRKVAGGFRFTEGPADNGKGLLVFSDIPNQCIVELRGDGSTRDLLKPSGRANGLMFDQAGYLYACQGGDRKVVRIDLKNDQKLTVLADSFAGKKLNSPNDLALDAHGGLYFTDPRYGNMEGMEQPVMGVYYLGKKGKVSRVIEDISRPNGILVSPDGKSLHVADPNNRAIIKYTITAPGKLTGKKLLFTGDADLDVRGPDGMAHDAAGNIYATYKSIVILAPEGVVIGRLEVPEHPANCTFGGKDRKTLYITARQSLYAIGMKIQGMALQPGLAAKAATRKVTAGPLLTLEVPVAWKQTEIAPFYRRFRLAQLEIPSVPGDSEPAECIVYNFPGGAGTVEANLARWTNQFAAEGRTSATTKGTATAGMYTEITVTGTYNKSVGPPVQRRSVEVKGAGMVALVLDTKKETYYIKMTGPEKTVLAAKKDLLAAIGAR